MKCNSGKTALKKVVELGALLMTVMVSVVVSGLISAQEMTVEETIKSRQHQLRDLGGAFKSVRDQLRSKNPNMYLIQPTIMQMKDLADAQHHWFPEGTGPEAGYETEAKKTIWTDPEGFKAAQEEFAATIPKFVDLAYDQDLEGLKKHYVVVGKSCKGCHDKYREED